MKRRKFGFRVLPFTFMVMLLATFPDDSGWLLIAGDLYLVAFWGFFAFTRPVDGRPATGEPIPRKPDYDRIAQLERDLGYTSPASGVLDGERPVQDGFRPR